MNVLNKLDCAEVSKLSQPIRCGVVPTGQDKRDGHSGLLSLEHQLYLTLHNHLWNITLYQSTWNSPWKKKKKKKKRCTDK